SKGGEQIALEAAGGGLAEDVETIADLSFLEVAEKGVDAFERLGLVRDEADVTVEPCVAREVEDAFAEARETTAVHAARGVVLIEQCLEVLERTVGLGAGERRHEMVDDGRAGTALGLRAFAGI